MFKHGDKVLHKGDSQENWNIDLIANKVYTVTEVHYPNGDVSLSIFDEVFEVVDLEKREYAFELIK